LTQPVPPIRVQRIIWAALLVSLVVYGVVALAMGSRPSGDPQQEDVMVSTFAVLALLVGGATIVLHRLAISGPVSRGALDLSSAAGQMRLYWVSLVTWVLSESIGIYGLALFLLFGRFLHLFAFLAAAAVLLLVYAPRGR
jgi:hypothetical protein